MSISSKGLVWGYGIQSTDVATAVAASSGLRVRREGGISDIKPGMVPIDAPIHRGLWGDHASDRRAGHYLPTFEMPGLLRPGLLDIVLAAVMDAETDVGGNEDYTLKSGTAHKPDTTKHLTIWRRNTFASSLDKKLTGAVIKAIRISSSYSQQKVHCDLSFIGYDYDDDEDGSGGTYTIPTENWLTHAGHVFEIGLGNAFQCPEFDITIDFGTVAILDNANNAQEFLLGPLTVEGTVLPPVVDGDVVGDYEAQGENLLIWRWGVADSSGFAEIIVPVKYDEPDEDEGEERLRQRIPFKYHETLTQALEISTQI